MKIIADEQIPYLRNFFGGQGELTALPAENITKRTLKNTDVALIRSVTPVTRNLLEDTKLRFIGSATAGVDHMDTAYLDNAGIAWANAPGCNARAVADYVLLTVAQLMQANIFQTTKQHAGVIGVGNVGQEVANRLNALGFDVVLNDPLRALDEIDFVSTPLNQFYDLNFICVHTPLTTEGEYPTHHLLNQNFFSQLNPNCVLLNAGRGACIDTKAMKRFLFTTILDVWESEPAIDPDVLNSAYIATPHIAGYSQAAKYRATQQLFEQFSNHFEMDHYINPEEDPSEYVELNCFEPNWEKTALQIENLEALSNTFKKLIKENSNTISETFKQFRKAYAFRPEFNLETNRT